MQRIVTDDATPSKRQRSRAAKRSPPEAVQARRGLESGPLGPR